MEIIDNFIDQIEFDKLQTEVMGGEFIWFYNDDIDIGKNDPDKNKYPKVDNFMFTHMFYFSGVMRSQDCGILNPIFKIINPISLWRIKANLLTRTPKIVENIFHVDIGGTKKDGKYFKLSEEKLKHWTTSIFYMNTNNGYTKFEDGTKVESIANRFVTFPANMKHYGTSCTDEKRRVVINFNYFK